MDLGQQDFNRILFFEHARKNAEAAYAKNPLDVENLTNWAGVLMELSQFQSARSDSIKFVKVEWWIQFGDETPELQKFAVKVLGLTCSSSGCERNWSTYNQVHTKRRNRLSTLRMNSLVYIMYNKKLKEKYLKRKELKEDQDPLVHDDMASDDDWFIDDHADEITPSQLQEEDIGVDFFTTERSMTTTSSMPKGDAVSKLEEALEINPRKHDVIWTLGNAQTSLAFYTEDLEDAKPYFAKAMQWFQQALEEDPGNQLYMKSLELAWKAPDLHTEFHREMANQQTLAGDSSTSKTKVSKKKENDDLKYDILGWLILAIGIVAWVGMAKSHVPPQPPR